MNSIRDKQNNLYDNNQQNSEEFEKLRKKRESLFEEHGKQHEACLKCLSYYQHKTVQDAAKWIFEGFDPSMSSSSGSYVHHEIDFNKFKTMDEVYEAWNEANESSHQADAEKHNSLPEGRISGTNIFEDTGFNKITSSLQSLTKEEIYPNNHQYMLFQKDTAFEALITIDQRDNEYHICLTQDRDMGKSGGIHTQNHIEAIATAIYNRALEQEKQKKLEQKLLSGDTISSKASGMLSTLVNIVSNNTKQGINPKQFNFYIHHPPEYLVREQFFSMDMKFNNGSFEKAEFNACEFMPKAIRDAYMEFKYKPVEANNYKIDAPIEILEHDN